MLLWNSSTNLYFKCFGVRIRLVSLKSRDLEQGLIWDVILVSTCTQWGKWYNEGREDDEACIGGRFLRRQLELRATGSLRTDPPPGAKAQVFVLQFPFAIGRWLLPKLKPGQTQTYCTCQNSEPVSSLGVHSSIVQHWRVSRWSVPSQGLLTWVGHTWKGCLYWVLWAD